MSRALAGLVNLAGGPDGAADDMYITKWVRRFHQMQKSQPNMTGDSDS